MALTGTEPVSAANLKALADSGAMGGGLSSPIASEATAWTTSSNCPIR